MQSNHGEREIEDLLCGIGRRRRNARPVRRPHEVAGRLVERRDGLLACVPLGDVAAGADETIDRALPIGERRTAHLVGNLLALPGHERRLDGHDRPLVDDLHDVAEDAFAVVLGHELEAVHLRYLLVCVPDRPRERLVPPQHSSGRVERVDGVRRRLEDALGDGSLLAEFAFAGVLCGEVPKAAVNQRPSAHLDDAGADFDGDGFAVGAFDEDGRAVLERADAWIPDGQTVLEQVAVALRLSRGVEFGLVHPDDLLARPTEQVLGSGVRLDDVAGIGVGDEDGVGGGIEERAVLALGFGERALAPFESRSGLCGVDGLGDGSR